MSPAEVNQYSGPGHLQHPTDQTRVVVVNESDKLFSNLWIHFIDDKNISHKSNPFSIGPREKRELGVMPQSPAEWGNNWAIAILKDQSFIKGGENGIPMKEVFHYRCGDGSVAVGLTLTNGN